MQTEPYWVCVGPDFVERMGAKPAEPASDPTVVAFPVAGEGAWSQIATRLQADDPGVFNAWFAPLVSLGERNRVLRLKVPSKFHGSFLRTHHLGRLQALARFQGCEVELVD